MKKLLIRLSLLIALGAVAWGGYTVLKKIPQTREAQIPFAKVRQGDVVVRTYARGEMRAVRSAPLYAPNLFGTVQVTKIAPLGSFAREKDLVVEFDDSEVLSRVEEKQLELDQIDEQTKKAEADLAIRNNQDQVELLRTRYAVRRAELEVKRNPLLGEIDQKRNLLNLQEAERRLKQLESDIKSRREQAQAELGVLRERKNKAMLEMRRERLRLNQVKLLSPMSGLVAIRQNRGGGFFVSGMSVPDIREGDQVQPGVPVADILDLSEMEVIARIGELDRANLKEGQEVFITLDALADKRLKGTIKSMSGTASANIFSNDPAKKFDVLFSIDMKELLTHLGAKPDQIARVLAQAEANRKKPVAAGPPMMAFGGGGMGMPGGGGPGPGMVMMGPGGGAPAGGGPEGGPRMGFNRGGAGGAGGEGAPAMSPEQQQKMREIFTKVTAGQNVREMSPEDRQKMMQKVQEELKKAGITAPAGMGRGGRGGQGGEGRGGGRGEGGQGGERAGRGEGGQGEERAGRGEGGGRGGRGGRGGEGGGAIPGLGAAQQFSEQDLNNAKLPPPPEDDNQLEVLLRPGLLADVEIIVERIPNAIHIPAQAVFDKGDGRSTVFVKEGNRFVARVVKPMKRSENTMVIASGLKPGEDVALADPEAKPSAGKKGEKKSSGGGSPMIPSGKGGQ